MVLGLNSRLDRDEEIISKLKDKSEGIAQSTTQKVREIKYT